MAANENLPYILIATAHKPLGFLCSMERSSWPCQTTKQFKLQTLKSFRFLFSILFYLSHNKFATVETFWGKANNFSAFFLPGIFGAYILETPCCRSPSSWSSLIRSVCRGRDSFLSIAGGTQGVWLTSPLTSLMANSERIQWLAHLSEALIHWLHLHYGASFNMFGRWLIVCIYISCTFRRGTTDAWINLFAGILCPHQL